MKNILLLLTIAIVVVGGTTLFRQLAPRAPAGATVVAAAASPAASAVPLGDLSKLRAIVTDTQAIAQKGDLVAAEKRITDYETAWDTGEPTLRPLNTEAWTFIDHASDAAISTLRSSPPPLDKVRTTLAALVAALDNPAPGAPPAAATASATTAALVNPDGSPVPCEVGLRQARAAAVPASFAAADKAKVDDLIARGVERCNADDDAGADGLFAQALGILKP